MMKKDPVRLYVYLSALDDQKSIVLGAWTVMQKSVLRLKVPLAGTKQYFFSFFNKKKIKPDLISQSTTKTVI